jgi:hypothetical protein
MPVASPGAETQKLPGIPAAAGLADTAGRTAIRPVFVDDPGRRRRMLVRVGYVAAAACIGSLFVVGISLTAGAAGPLARIASPAVVPSSLLQPRREADVTTLAPAMTHALATGPVPQAAVAPRSVAAMRTERLGFSRTTPGPMRAGSGVLSAPTASGPTPAAAPTR